MARSSLSLVVLALAAAIPVGHWMARPATAAPRGTVVDVALADPRFSTLVAAVKAAGLVETLSGPGPFTVLAPTDEAFRALPAGTVETLLKPENVAQLAAILSYHVLPGRVTAADLARGTPMKTVLGPTVTARFDGGRLLLGSAPVLATDVDASNGVVHVIGAVLLPPAAPAAAPTGRLARAVGVVERALDVGVPLYNGGNHAACAAAYELAALSVATLADDVVPADVRDALLAAVASRAAPMDRAWTLRAALDRVLALATPRTGAAAPPPAPARATASAAVPASSIVLDRAGFATSFERAAAALDARDRAGALALVDDAVRRLGSDSRAGARLATASAAAASGEVTGVTALRRLLLELRDDFRFEPMREADARPLRKAGPRNCTLYRRRLWPQDHDVLSRRGADALDCHAAWPAPSSGSRTASENFFATTQERGQVHEAEIALTADGKVLGIHDVFLHDAGAYAPYGLTVAAQQPMHAAGPV
ncbi:MAG: fasciclin domain-containing protein [Ottowia sp.]